MPDVTKRQPRKFKSYPGSIYKQGHCARLYIAYKGVRMSTGLPDTKMGRKMAEELLWDVYRRDKGLPTARQEQGQEDTGAVTYDDAIKAYEKHLEVTDRSDRTRYAYLDTVKRIIVTPGFISPEDIDRQLALWLAKNKKKYAPSSVNIHLRNFNVFVKWIRKKKWLKDDVDVFQYRRKGDQKVVKVYTDEVCDKLIAHFEKRAAVNTKMATKKNSLLKVAESSKEFALLLRFLLATGVRINEALRLRWDDVLDDGIVFPNKNRRNPEMFPLSNEINEILKELPRDREKVFSWAYSSRATLSKTLHAAFDDLELERHGGFHVFRKTFQDRLKRADVDMSDRQKLMRHRNIKTTIESYTYSDTGRLKDVLDKVTGTRHGTESSSKKHLKQRD